MHKMSKHESDGFFPLLIGGLGNQMFILAAGYVCGRVHGRPLYLPSTISFQNPHHKSKENYITSLFQNFGLCLQMSESELRSSVLAHYKRYKPKGFGPWFPHEVTPGTYMDSYFQYYPPLAPFEKEIRERFLVGLKQKKADLQMAFLHIRRGDYLNHPDYHYIQSVEYYEHAISQLLEKNPAITKIKLFSDDIAWVKEQPLFKKNTTLFIFSEKEDELDALCEMASCHGGAIIANSTFSWWGAFLGAYSVRAPIFYPSRWIAEDVPSLCPSEWICL